MDKNHCFYSYSGWAFSKLLTDGEAKRQKPLPPLPKISRTHLSKKYMKHATHSLSSADISMFVEFVNVW